MIDDGTRKKLDDLAVEIGTASFDLQMSIAKLVMKILEHKDNYSSAIEIEIPCKVNDVYKIISCRTIYFDIEQEELRLTLEDDSIIKWNDIDLSAMDLIATMLHMDFLSNGIYDDLKS